MTETKPQLLLTGPTFEEQRDAFKPPEEKPRLKVGGVFYTEEQLASCRAQAIGLQQAQGYSQQQLALQQQAMLNDSDVLRQMAYCNQNAVAHSYYNLAQQASQQWMANFEANHPSQSVRQRAVEKKKQEIVETHVKFKRAIDAAWDKMLAALFNATEIASETYWILCYRQRLAAPSAVGSVAVPLSNYQNMYIPGDVFG